MPPLIPFEFDPPSANYEEAHLTYQDVPNGQVVSWPVVGVSLLLLKDKYLTFEEIQKNNRGKFTHCGLSGFSVGTYHEFLVTMPNEKYIGFKIGRIEVTFGQATPLAAMLFEAYHREKYFGEWHSITTLRIVGASADEAEISFINACTAYEAKFGILPELVAMDENLLFQYDEDENADFVEQIIFPASYDY